MILIISDSHCAAFNIQNKVPDVFPEVHENKEYNIKFVRLGPATAHNITKKHEMIVEAMRLSNIYFSDRVMLMFGEVDCRAHISRIHRQTGEDISSLCQKTANNLFLEVDKLDKMGFDVGVISTIPSTWLDEKITDSPNDFPRYGDMKFRNQIAQWYNFYLETNCKHGKIPYLNIFDKLLNEDLSTNKDMYIDNIHVRGSSLLPLIKDDLKRINDRR